VTFHPPKIEIPVKEFLRDPFFKALGQIVCPNYFDYAP